MRVIVIAAAALLGGWPALAQESKPPTPAGPETESVHVVLTTRDGNRVLGVVRAAEFKIRTEYGELTVPAEEVMRIRIGKNADKELTARIKELIEKLAAEDFKEREAAAKELAKLGPVVISDLRRAATDDDPEVKKQAVELLSEMEKQVGSEEQVPPDDDEIVAKKFTMLGELQVEAFEVETRYGTLRIPKKEVKVVYVGTGYVEEKKFKLGSAHRGPSPLDTGIRVEAGARVEVTAKGSIRLRYASRSCGPDGVAQLGQQYDGVPTGALMARIGDGPFFKVGSRFTFNAKSSGVLRLAIGVKDRYPITGQFEVTVRVEK